MNIIDTPSPNFNKRPKDTSVTMLVLHYTGMKSADEALERMCDSESEVSAHYMVDEGGNIHQLVDEKNRAWHAGVSSWRGQEGVNDVSIGVELCNFGHEFGYTPFEDLQMVSVVELCESIVKRHSIPRYSVVAHSDIAPSRKQDPGELFDWAMLADRGVGLCVNKPYEYQVDAVLEIGHRSNNVTKLQRKLVRLGYALKVDGYFGVEMSYVVEAFQRHWAQARMDGSWDKDMQRVLDELL